MNEIKCSKVRFYSHRDEAAFFAFAEGIPAVRKIVGDADSIVLVLRPKVSENSLRELIALLLRYKVDMRALAALENEKNSSWFRDPGAFWYKKVFSSPDRKKTRNQTALPPSHNDLVIHGLEGRRSEETSRLVARKKWDR